GADPFALHGSPRNATSGSLATALAIMGRVVSAVPVPWRTVPRREGPDEPTPEGAAAAAQQHRAGRTRTRPTGPQRPGRAGGAGHGAACRCRRGELYHGGPAGRPALRGRGRAVGRALQCRGPRGAGQPTRRWPGAAVWD